MVKRHIFACGGGSFTGDFNPRMRRRMVELCGTNSPRVLLIPTASGDPADRVLAFPGQCEELGFTGEVMSLFDTQSWKSSPAEMIQGADIIWVGGGSTFNMLALWRAWNLVPLLRSAYDDGKVMGGVSAGAICWFEQGNTDSLGPGLSVMECLGWIPGSCTPHWSGEALRKPTLARQLAESSIKPGVAIDDFCTVHFVNEVISEVIADLPNCGAYKVTAHNNARIGTDTRHEGLYGN